MLFMSVYHKEKMIENRRESQKTGGGPAPVLSLEGWEEKVNII